jgi:membrane protease YdiL (CAAX protease family)
MKFLQNPLPALSRREKYIGTLYLAFQWILLPTLLRLIAEAFGIATSGTLINVLYFAINFICCIAIFGNLLKQSFCQSRENPERLLFGAAVGFGVHRVASIVVSLFTALLLPDFVNLNDESLVSILGDYPVLMMISTAFLAPVAEELFYRGLVFGWLREKNVTLAYILSALIFASLHVMQYIGIYSPLQVVVALVRYLPAGIIFAWAYQYSGSIFAPILIHAVNNLLAILIVR